jgi:hypothetical protein
MKYFKVELGNGVVFIPMDIACFEFTPKYGEDDNVYSVSIYYGEREVVIFHNLIVNDVGKLMKSLLVGDVGIKTMNDLNGY